MSNPSPTCQVKDGAGAYGPTTSGVNVTPANTITINLVSSAGVNTWSISCVYTDELSSAATITAALSINSVAKTATFTAPVAGRAYIFQSTVNSGVDVNGVAQSSYTTTFGVYTLTAASRRVHAVNETFESDATFGWIAGVNDLTRNPTNNTLPTGTGFWHITGGSSDGAAKTVANADVDAAAAIAVTKLAASVTNENVLKTIGGIPTWSTINLASSSAVGTSKLPAANGGLAADASAFGGLLLFTAGVATALAPGSSGNIPISNGSTWAAGTLSSVPHSFRLVNSNVSLATTDEYVNVDTTAARTLTLPTPATGLRYIVKDSTGGCNTTNTITLIRHATEKIEGVAASKVFVTAWGGWEVWSDGTDWFVK